MSSKRTDANRKKQKKVSKKLSSPVVRKLTAGMKKDMDTSRRLSVIEQSLMRANQLKVDESKVIAELIFAVNSISRAVVEKKIKVTTICVDDNNKPILDGDTYLMHEVEIPLLTIEEFNESRARVIAQFKKEREDREKVFEHKGVSKTAESWAEDLGIAYEEFQESLNMGIDAGDIIDTYIEEKAEAKDGQSEDVPLSGGGSKEEVVPEVSSEVQA